MIEAEQPPPLAPLSRHRPWLQFDSRELYAPSAVEAVADLRYTGGPGSDYGTVLRRGRGRGSTVIASSAPDLWPGSKPLTAAFLGPEYEGYGPASGDDYLDANNETYIADARASLVARPPVVYGRDVQRPNRRRWLQYWFFYYFNSKHAAGLGVHEGDWEMIQIGVDDEEEPEVVTFAQHGEGEQAPWDPNSIDIEDDGPVVYVALGSHASLPQKGKHRAPIFDDVCDAGGKRIRPAVAALGESVPQWLLWPGRWGASRDRLPFEYGSPRSPAHQRAWTDPDGFHERAAAFRSSPFGTFRLTDEMPSRPLVWVASDGLARNIRYEVPGALPEDWVAELRIWVWASGERRALHYVADVTPKPPLQSVPRAVDVELDDPPNV